MTGHPHIAVLAGNRIEFLHYAKEHPDETLNLVYVHNLEGICERVFHDYVKVGTFGNRPDAIDLETAVKLRLR